MAEEETMEWRRAEAGAMALGMIGESVGPAVRLLRNILTARIAAAFEPFGLRQGSFSTLALIGANPGCSQADIVREIAMDKSLVVGILDDLERRGLARRERSAEDRRRNRLFLTDAGAACARDLRDIADTVEDPIRAALSPAEMEALVRLTRRAVDALQASEPGAGA